MSRLSSIIRAASALRSNAMPIAPIDYVLRQYSTQKEDKEVVQVDKDYFPEVVAADKYFPLGDVGESHHPLPQTQMDLAKLAAELRAVDPESTWDGRVETLDGSDGMFIAVLQPGVPGSRQDQLVQLQKKIVAAYVPALPQKFRPRLLRSVSPSGVESFGTEF